jgi:hypothetical protein
MTVGPIIDFTSFNRVATTVSELVLISPLLIR